MTNHGSGDGAGKPPTAGVGGHVSAPGGDWQGTPGAAAESVHAVVTGAHSSFFWAMRLLPREKRVGMYAVYAFARTVDDIADGPAPVAEKLTALAAWRTEIRKTFDGHPGHPVTVALYPHIERFGLYLEDCLALIEGMEMDAGGHMVAPSLLELELYCRRAAGAVGMLSVCIFGLPRPEGRSLALSLGQALQYTNILRDLSEDAQLGRIYIHRELLDEVGIQTRDPVEVLRHPALPEACAQMVRMAHERFDIAARVLQACPVGPSRPARAMLRIYRELLRKLEARGFACEDLETPVRVGTLRRFWIAVSEALRPAGTKGLKGRA